MGIVARRVVFRTSPGRAAAVSLLGDDHDYQSDDPDELAAFTTEISYFN